MDNMLAKFKHHRFLLALYLIGLCVIPMLYKTGVVQIETINLLGRYMAFAIVAVGLDLLWGYTGILSLCQALFFALGGYAMGMHLALHGPLDGDGIPRALYVVSSSVAGLTLPWFWVPFKSLPWALFLGLLVPGLLAFVVGYYVFVSRVRGVYFAILTQALTVAVWLMFCKNDIKLCGTNGLTNFVTLAGYDLRLASTKLGLYMITVFVLGMVYFLCWTIVHSRLGKVLIAIRDNENTLCFSGYHSHQYKLFLFVLAAMIGGLGGMLYTPQVGIMTPAYMEAKWSILVVVWVAVGGRGTLTGAIIGVLLVNMIYNYLTTVAPNAWPFFQGFMFIGVILFFSGGVMGLLELGKSLIFKSINIIMRKQRAD
jgi:urea transport system permease protein